MSKTLALIAAMTLATVTAASALTINNQDSKNHDLKLRATGSKHDVKIKVQASNGIAVGQVVVDPAQIDCSKGCTAHLGKDKGAADIAVPATAQTITIGKDGKITVQ